MKDNMTIDDFNPARFLDLQLSEWPLARDNYSFLADVLTKSFDIDGMRFTVQHNPARALSTGAVVDKGAIDSRPCFLCRDNRPAGQLEVPFGDDYSILVNPYPIAESHFTIINNQHVPQSIKGRLAKMIALSEHMAGHVVFYNGPRCGASAPDHMHFQAADAGVFSLPKALREGEGRVLATHDKTVLSCFSSLPVKCFVIDFEDSADASEMFENVLLPALGQSVDLPEPDMNLLVLPDRVVVIPRKRHRPDFFGTEGDGCMMVSPASVDLGGMMVLPRRVDFDRVDAAVVREVLRQVCLSDEEMDEVCQRICPSEPEVRVGIKSAPKIEVFLNGEYEVSGRTVSGLQRISVSSDGCRVVWNGEEIDAPLFFTPLRPCEASFVIRDVTIGVNFHWQREENQCFKGKISFIAESGMATAINIIDVEDYLLSVIASEMSATSSLEFLKSHAVISRSWLMAQISGKKVASPSSGNAQGAPDEGCGEYIRWYDHDDHRNFDVCADDHCQRYQGISRQTTPVVKEAVEHTRGEVMMYGDELVDARFSKCCGGVFEEFETCWQPVHHPYLVARRDAEEEADFPDLRKEHQAQEWILSAPEAFCANPGEDVLAQVLNGYDRETIDFYRWSVEYTQEELAELIRTRSGIDFGRILYLNPMERGTSGRLSRLEIVGSERSMVIGKELEIRRVLSSSHLRSSAIVIERCDVDPLGVPSRFIIHGAGWGHGVGLCQIGAAVMGQRGYGYTDILEHYFPGATVKKIY